MHESFISFGEPNQEFKRNDSLSTIDSSLAAADVMRQYADLSKSTPRLPVVPTSSPPNMKFEKSENINVIYNTYYNNPSPERRSSKNNSFTSFLSYTKKTTTAENFMKFLRTKKGAAIVFGTFIVILTTIAAVVCYYVILAYRPNDFDFTTSLETSTTEASTTEITTTIDPTVNTTDKQTAEPSTSTSTITSTIPQPTATEPNQYPEFYMTRDDWGAEPPRSLNISKLETPATRIIVGHTGGKFCFNVTDCKAVVKSIQTQNLSLEDIAYNFLIGADGNVYEGRGFEYQGEHTMNVGATEYNSIGIMVAFIGNYKSTDPSDDQILLLDNFIKFFQQSGSISDQYSLFSQDDLMFKDVTADSLNSAVAKMQNYRSLYKIHRREEWRSLIPKDLPKFSEIMTWNIIGHITDQSCSSLSTCIKEIKKVETDNLRAGYSDIVYNFLLAGKGLLFEGRGWNIIGQTNLLPNSAISVMVIGDYRFFSPDPEVENSLKQLFENGLILGKLTHDYKVFGRSDFGKPGPGAFLMDQIKKWERYGNKTVY